MKLEKLQEISRCPEEDDIINPPPTGQEDTETTEITETEG